MVSPGPPSWAMELVLSALRSPREGLHTLTPPMVLAEGTMMPSEAKEVIPESLGTGWSEETHGPLWNTVTWTLQMMWTSSEPSTAHSWPRLEL